MRFQSRKGKSLIIALWSAPKEEVTLRYQSKIFIRRHHHLNKMSFSLMMMSLVSGFEQSGIGGVVNEFCRAPIWLLMLVIKGLKSDTSSKHRKSNWLHMFWLRSKETPLASIKGKLHYGLAKRFIRLRITLLAIIL